MNTATRSPRRAARSIRSAAKRARSTRSTALERPADKLEQLTRPSDTPSLTRAPLRPRSPLDRERARTEGELYDTMGAELHAVLAVAEAKATAERAERAFLRAAEAGDRIQAEALLVPVREAAHELSLADCRRVRERCEGEHLSYARFS